jgi:hypothetical protein
MSPWSRERRFRDVRGTSALPPILTVTADILDRQLGANNDHRRWLARPPSSAWLSARDFAQRDLWNVSGRALLWFDVCRPNDPRPLFGVAGQKLSKLSGGTRR